MHEFIIDRVKAFLLLFVPPAFRLPCGQAACVIRVGLEGTQLRQRVNAAFKGNLRGGKQLVVFLHQLIFPLHFGNDVGRKGLFLYLGIDEENIAVFGGEFPAEGRCKQRLQPCLAVFLQLRLEAVPEFPLAVVEFVAGVYRMTDKRQGGHCVNRLLPLFLFKEDCAGFFVALRVC